MAATEPDANITIVANDDGNAAQNIAEITVHKIPTSPLVPAAS